MIYKGQKWSEVFFGNFLNRFRCSKIFSELNHWPREQVNVDWPERLAKLVAQKGDGTRLVHLTHLNAGNTECAARSGIIAEQTEAIVRMREAYPDTVIVKEGIPFLSIIFGRFF